jgi:hypothetical protein
MFGALVLTLFGAIWLAAANFVAGGSLAVYALIAMLAAVLIVASRRSSQWKENAGSGWDAATAKAFGRINGLQSLGALVVIVVCNILDQPNRIPGGIELVVGLHFLPLARLFGVRAYYVTGVVMSACGIATAALGARSSIVLAALTAGVTLWVTIAFRTIAAAPRLRSG